MAITNLQALAGSVNYPIEDVKLQKILIDRSIDESGSYTGLSKDFELATADVYVLLITSANISEGGYQISMTDKSNMIKLASGIYSKYGVSNPLKPKVTFSSDRW